MDRRGSTYPPSTASIPWATEAGQLHEVLATHRAALLPDGMVLAVGGSGAGWPRSAAEFYDPVTDRFLAAGVLGQGRSAHIATLLSDGTVRRPLPALRLAVVSRAARGCYGDHGASVSPGPGCVFQDS